MLRKFLILQTFLCLFAITSYSQVCSNCTSYDVKIVNISLSYDPSSSCPDSNTLITNAKINVSLTITSKKRYGFYMYYELWIDGKPASPFYYKKCFPLELPQGNVTLPIIDLPPFYASQKLEIKNVLTAWDNNLPASGTYFCENLDGYSCNAVAPKCKFYSASFPINIDLKPTVSSINTNNNICPGGTATFNIKGTPLAKINYQIDNIIDSLQLDSTGSAVVSKTNANSDVTLVVNSMTTTTCSSTINNVSAVVKVNSVATPGKITGSQRICYGTDPTIIISSEAASGIGTIHYLWQKKTASTTWTNIPGATGESLDDNSLIFEETLYRRLTIADGCNEIASNEIAVSLFQFYGGSVSGDQVVCPNTIPSGFTSIEGSNGGSFMAYQWQKSYDSGSTWVDIAGAALATYQENNPVSVTTLYRRKAESLFTDKVCSSYSNILKVDILQLNAAGTIQKDQSICPLGDPAIITSANPRLQSISSYEYQWQYSYDGGNWIDIANANTETYDPPARSISTKTYFRRKIVMTVDLSGCNTDYTNAVVVNVTELETPGSISSDQLICSGSAPLMLQSNVDASVIDGLASYQWQMSTDTINWTNIVGASNNTISPSSITNTTYYRRMVNALSGSDICKSDYTNSVKIDVSKIETAGAISSDQVICSGNQPASFTSNEAASGNGSVAYQWEYSNNGSSWFAISGANGETYQPFALSALAMFRRVSGINFNNDFCNPTSSNVVTVSMGSVSNAGTITGSTMVCKGNDADIINGSDASTDLTGTISYMWQISSDNGASWSNINNEISKDLDPTDPILNTTMYRRIALFNLVTGEQCADNSYSNVLNINTASIESPGTISASQLICTGSAPAALNSNTDALANNASILYTWQSSTDGKNWNNVDGTNSVSFSPSQLSESTYFRRMANALIGTDICESNYTDPVLISVSKVDDAGSISGDQVICSSDRSSVLLSNGKAISAGSISYQWESSIDDGMTWNTITGAMNETYFPNASSLTTKYRRKAISSIDNTVCDNTNSNVVTVTVGNLSSAGNLSGSDLVCVGGNPAPFKAENAVSNTTSDFVKYQWQFSSDKGITWTNIANATSSNFDENSPVWSKMLYRRIATISSTSGKVCMQQISNQVDIDVRECERCNLLNEYTRGFPNPFKYNFTLRFRSCVTGPAYIELFDFAGAKIQVKKFPNVQAGEETIYEFFIPQSITGVIYKITSGKYSTVGRMITAY